MPTVSELLARAVAHHRSRQLAQAQELYGQVLHLDANNPDALHLSGVIFRDAGKLDVAVQMISRAIGANGRFAPSHVNLAEALRRCGRLDEALAAAERGLEVDPLFADAHTTRAAVLQSQGRTDEALREYTRAIELDPSLVDAHYNRAWIWLAAGDYARGWPEFEWRWKKPEFHQPPMARPRWDGSPLAGRTLLVQSEQGLGDTLQFIRYVRLLQAQGHNVLCVAQSPLVPLLRTSGIPNVFPPNVPLPHFDVHAPLLSLPYLLKTTVETVPAAMPYLSARTDLASHWRNRLGEIGGFTIGIHWQGNPNSPHEPRRSMRLANFESLARPGASLISLQKGFGVEQIPDASERFPLVDLSAQLDEANGPFMDTAAIMTALDLVVTSDTVTAHLAGALGARVWVPLAHESDWRWMHARSDTPWYPTMRLFRQSAPGDWAGVFERMAAELDALLGH
jgi:Tfp pilus assembly protein PilF